MKELENLPTPASEKDERYLQNLFRLDSIIKVLTDENKQGKLDCVLVERITKAAFPENNHREYNVSFLAASKSFTKLGVAAGLFTEEEGMKSFENQDNQVQRLALLQTYIDEQLQLIHKLAAGTPEKQAKKPKHIQNPHGNNLIDPRKAWKCSLCSGNHKDDRGRIRRYYFNNTCTFFATLSSRKKLEFLQKYKLCLICSGEKARKYHEEPCRRTPLFKCTICVERGNERDALTHNREVHSALKENHQANGNGRDGDPHGNGR